MEEVIRPLIFAALVSNDSAREFWIEQDSSVNQKRFNRPRRIRSPWALSRRTQSMKSMSLGWSLPVDSMMKGRNSRLFLSAISLYLFIFTLKRSAAALNGRLAWTAESWFIPVGYGHVMLVSATSFLCRPGTLMKERSGRTSVFGSTSRKHPCSSFSVMTPAVRAQREIVCVAMSFSRSSLSAKLVTASFFPTATYIPTASFRMSHLL